MAIKVLLVMMFIASLSTSTVAFVVPTFGSMPIVSRTVLSAVIEIGSEAAFDKKIKNSGSALVIVDYSTTWCGPCKGEFSNLPNCCAILSGPTESSFLLFFLFCPYFDFLVIAPKFEELSDKYPDAVFLKVIGDASPDASKLMKREGVRSVPSFHYFMKGEKVDVINGANAEAIEAAIAKLAHSAA